MLIFVVRSLQGNRLSGKIPSVIGTGFKLQQVNWTYTPYFRFLHGNQLTGSIPPELGNMSKLHYLELNDNQLTGHIPSELGKLTELYDLNVANNKLEGPIPSNLSSCTNLNSLNLSRNHLTGVIPAEFANLRSVMEMPDSPRTHAASEPVLIVDWENLPDLCVLKIFEKIDVPISQVKLSAVSKRWYSLFNTFLDHKWRSSTNRIPLLLIPSKKSSTKGKLYSLQSKSKVSEIELPKLQTFRFCGSCYGWLATVDQSEIITLSNPFKEVCSISLPRIDTGFFYIDNHPFTIPKVVLSEDPLLYPDSYVVTIIYAPYHQLAVYKSGQKDWIYIDGDEFNEIGFTDIIFHRNFVYAIRHQNILLSFDVNGIDGTSKSPKWNKLLIDADEYEQLGKKTSFRIYLVMSSMGNLYSIHKYLDFERKGGIEAHSTKRFDVFKLILDEENGKLLEKKEVNHIDGDIVFVGDNKTLAVSALVFPQGQPNSIYFTDDFFYSNAYEPFGPRDIGIFHLKDKSFEKYYQFKSSHKDLPPYIWIWSPVDFKPKS
ncbi:hypothetical protein V6N13_057939 [Hibiscus sabdariffa]